MHQIVIRSLFLALVCLVGMLPLAARAADDTSAADVAARVDQLRDLLATDRGAAILDLLGDPRVRQAILQDPGTPPSAPHSAATAGEMMDTTLSRVRLRLWEVGAELGHIPTQLERVRDQTQVLLPGSALLRLVAFLIVFVAGGIAAQFLFLRLARPWRAHFGVLTLETPRQRLSAVCERLVFVILIIAVSAAGSMGTFLLFAWPPLTGSIILGYLLAFLAIRLGKTVIRFFLAPNAERLRLVNVCTDTAWYWHRWVAWLVGVAAIGWQTIQTLRSLGMADEGSDVLRQLLLLVLTAMGVWIVWRVPTAHHGTTRSRRDPVVRLLLSLGLVFDWLLFVMGASALAWTLLILAAIPVTTLILGQSISMVVLGRWPESHTEPCAHVAIARRAMQTLVIILAAVALVHVWHIDMTKMSNMDTPMTRVIRGLLEALVILVIADLLWQVVRVLIDERLAGDQPPIDALDDEELRRQARLRTLLPVLRNFAFFIVLVMASLSALAAMGLQIGPLLAGAGVVGIAVGFGAQTLVRDILSGVFFLLDDAFRVGEQIESGDIRGTVESFSLRSVKLRHLNGQLHTVPFGDLKAITNYSRDWVVESLHVVVTYDTDLDLLESVVETVSDQLMANPSVATELIEPLRSLGVQAMVDTGMQVGMMFKTRPGRQFAVRRVAYSQIRTAFAAHGIRFATAVAQPMVGATAG
ncbi:MAG TPA: mechanosensitive ion channel domain-containing protein [Acetobacteraceae bacterium]